MAGERIVITENDPVIARGLLDSLESEGFQVFLAETGKVALELVRQHNPHLLLLDIRLPDISGYEVCSQLRKEGWQLPILTLIPRDDEDNKNFSLESGANGSFSLPTPAPEVISSIQAYLRRYYGKLEDQFPGNRFRFGDIDVNFGEQVVLRGVEPIPLTPTEFRLLHHLINHRKRSLSRSELLVAVWGYEDEIEGERKIDVHIRHLRAKLEENPSNPRWILTARGIGYKFEP